MLKSVYPPRSIAQFLSHCNRVWFLTFKRNDRSVNICWVPTGEELPATIRCYLLHNLFSVCRGLSGLKSNLKSKADLSKNSREPWWLLSKRNGVQRRPEPGTWKRSASPPPSCFKWCRMRVIKNTGGKLCGLTGWEGLSNSLAGLSVWVFSHCRHAVPRLLQLIHQCYFSQQIHQLFHFWSSFFHEDS